MSKKKGEPVSWPCPDCQGKGTVSIPVLNDGKYSTKNKPCKKCKGSGKLVWVNDTLKRRNGMQRTKGGIWLPNKN